MKPALLLGAGMLLCPATLLAQSQPGGAVDEVPPVATDPDAPSPHVHVTDDAETSRPLLPAASDLLGSHVLIGAGVAPTWSLGKLGSELSARDALGTGFGGRLDAGFGVSRAVSLGVWGSFAGYTSGNDCAVSCAGRAFSVGPFVRYHLSQGLRFNPWLALGAGFRQLSFKDSGDRRRTFSGVEWLHFELGGDFYALSGLAFGPYGSLGLSSYSKRPTLAGDASVNVELSVGLRLLVDLPGR